MSCVDEKKFITSADPGFFKIGDVLLSISADNIEISRHENYQAVSYLRDSHAMKIHTGRSVLRVNATFPILVDKQLPQLQAIVAMTRVTPFVPIQNKFIQGQIRIYDDAPTSFELNKTLDAASKQKINSTLGISTHTEEGEPTYLEALPMAILGMSVTMGGDSPEIAECSISMIYWNPIPWFGIDLQYWKGDALIGLNADYSRYIKNRIIDKSSDTFDSTVFRWKDVKLFSELKEMYSKELAKAKESIKPSVSQTKVADAKKIIVSNEDSASNFDDFNNFLQFMSNRTSIDDFVEGIASVETGSFRNNSGWDKTNKNTGVAGRYQMAYATFNGVFFRGADTADGIPLAEKLAQEKTLVANSNDTILNNIVKKKSGSTTLKNKKAFAEWYARPEMAELQTYVMQEYAKGLYKKHGGDAVASALEYFLGAPDAKPYINHWKKYHTIKDWSAKDKDRLGSINASPPIYMHRMFKNFANKTEAKGYTIDASIPTIDPISYDSPSKGPLPTNRKGDVLGAAIRPTISKEEHEVLAGLGWKQIALLDDGRPFSNIINPLFERMNANIIDLSAGGITDAENQVVTSITVAFQNRFASLPVQGWPYPALQHMGSIDSEIRMTVACLSDSQQYSRLQQAQGMLHEMSSRSRRYHSDVHDGREILVLTKLSCNNKLLNSLGISDVIMTDLSIQMDSQATNMVRGELVMTESAFDVAKEKLVATLGKNDRRFRDSLREEWLATEKYKHSSNSSVVNMGERLRALQIQNDRALATNKDILFETGQLQRVVANSFLEDDDFRSLVPLTREDNQRHQKQLKEITEFVDVSRSRGIRLSAAKLISPTVRVLNKMESIPVAEFNKQNFVIVPVNPNELLNDGTGLLDWASNILQGLYKSDKALDEGPLDIDRIKGDASQFLNTSFGINLAEIWQQLNSQPNAAEFSNLLSQFFNILIKALHEWYNRNILEAMLLFLYHRNESDSTFAELVARNRNRPGTGNYKDLFLDTTPSINPYEWLDSSIEPKILAAMESIVAKTEGKIGELIKEYNIALRQRHRTTNSDVSVESVSRDETKSLKNDKEAGERAYRNGIQATLKQAPINAVAAASSLKDFSAVNFTMRRAFPAYRMYFIEEDNQGIIKRFDDFYNYNAILDIQMIKYKHRPATMVITMTNLFGHLDAKTFDDMANRDELAEAIRANATGGTLPTQIRETGPNGENETIDADGTVGPLREIMLKPGTKIVMKLGYENDPDNLPTTFAGQVTEVSGGAILTIVCQDWMSELLTGASKDDGFDVGDMNLTSIEGVKNAVKYSANTSSTRDLQNTSTARATIGSIMKQRSVAHFGHWQLDKTKRGRDSNYFGYRRESTLIPKIFDNKFTKSLAIIFHDEVEARSEALINIHPQPQSFYSAFGVEIGATFPRKRDLESMSYWELIEMQRRLMPNHVAFVRPYGQGDATLYFGPPWGVYVANEFDGEIDASLSEDILTTHNKEVFRDMIRQNATISIAGISRFGESWKMRIGKDLWNKIFGSSLAKNSNTLDVPIAAVLSGFGEILIKESDRKFLDVSQMEDAFGKLDSGSSDKTIDLWYDMFISTLRGGGIHDDHDAHSILINIQSRVRKIQGAMLFIKAKEDPSFDPSGSIRKAIKPVRRWHIATAKHHIIANNIQINNNFANEIRNDEKVIRYDTEMIDRRTRFANSEMPELADPMKSVYMTSLLADELRTMYRGQLVLTGNAEINPHDIIVIFDETRHMRGAIEVDKVNHIFNQEMGFITIVEPHLIVEQGDYSLSTAITAFFTALADDITENNETGAGYGVNKAVSTAINTGYNVLGQTFGGPLTKLAASYIITQVLVAGDARNHPLTIYPLVKRDIPWVGGIEGASGRGILGVLAGKFIHSLENIDKFINALSNKVDTIGDAIGVIPNTLEKSGFSSGPTDDSTLRNYE